MIILEILKDVIVPLLILISIGYMLNQFFSFHVGTLAKLNLYFYIPVLVFTKIFETSMDLKLFLLIVLFLFLQVTLLYVITLLASIKFEKKLRSSMVNSTVLINAGNFGLPVNGLAFNHDPLALSVHIIVMAIQNFLTFSLGVINAKASDVSLMQGLVEYIKSPIFFAIILGLVGNIFNIEIPPFLKGTIWSIAEGFFVFALITFGAQMAFKNLRGYLVPLIISLSIRLLGAPLLAYGIIIMLDIEGVVAAALLIASALPSSRNSALLALEYKNHPDFAAQAVLLTTLLGSLTITFIIYLAKVQFM